MIDREPAAMFMRQGRVMSCNSIRLAQRPWIALHLRAAMAFLAISLTSGCMVLQPYRTVIAPPGDVQECAAGSAPTAPGARPCLEQATERNALYTMHVVEFDDEGGPFDTLPNEQAQIDAAVGEIKAQLRGTSNCVRLFVYVHGWRHSAKTTDSNVMQFREFLAQVARSTRRSSAAGEDSCADPAFAEVPAARRPQAAQRAPRKQDPAEVKTVGIYVGWRGLSLVDVKPLVYASFWDRKNTADRVAQGSVRELFGRLNALANYAPASDKAQAQTLPAKTSAQLRTYVIGHSFGASIAFRALSQSLIDSFSEDLDVDADGELASISRFVDMVVLVNPAIEAARFDPVYRAARKHQARCESNATSQVCQRPRYQSPVLAIFTSEGDKATQQAFPVGAALSNTFENTRNDAQRQSIVKTIGWDDNYQTHRLSESTACDVADATPFDTTSDPLRYRAPGWTWCFRTQSGSLSIKHLGPESRPQEGPVVYNGPLWNVRVPETIMKDHNDTWNDKFRDLLLYLFTDQRRHPAIF